jgi:hypothetical protein
MNVKGESAGLVGMWRHREAAGQGAGGVLCADGEWRRGAEKEVVGGKKSRPENRLVKPSQTQSNQARGFDCRRKNAPKAALLRAGCLPVCRSEFEMSAPLNLTRLKVQPLAERRSLARLEDILVDPEAKAPPCSDPNLALIRQCAKDIAQARAKKAAVMLIYGAHLIKNGAALILIRLMQGKWLTHLATNGAGAIHDWEFTFRGFSTESVKENVATGTFGSWEETGRNINLALLAGGLEGAGFGRALGGFVAQDGVTLPSAEVLEKLLREEPSHPLSPARAELLQAMRVHELRAGRHTVRHPCKDSSVLGQSFSLNVPLTIHPGIGYDIISNHPMFNGAAIGRAAEMDYRIFGGSVEDLDGGVVLSVGSAIMGPQVFEKSLSCVNNLRLQAGRAIVSGHSIYVVDLQDGGRWDWTKGEPPKDNPAYYLRFCKSYSRMGGTMRYLQIDNVAFLHHLLGELGR